MSDNEAVPDASPSDVSESREFFAKYKLNVFQTAGLLQERLQAWKHACGYVENYIQATEKFEKAHAKEYEKVLKVRVIVTQVFKTNH